MARQLRDTDFEAVVTLTHGHTYGVLTTGSKDENEIRARVLANMTDNERGLVESVVVVPFVPYAKCECCCERIPREDIVAYQAESGTADLPACCEDCAGVS